MINFDEYVNEKKNVHNKNWPYIPDHPYRILIIFEIWKNKCMIKLNRKSNRHYKIYLYAKDLFECKYHYVKKRLKV